MVERRKLPTANAADFEYYIHYTEFNRRNDTWVTLGLMDLSTLNFEDCEVRDAAGRVIKKRKVDLEHEEGHEDFDPTARREHEEFTKVRNVLSIELGKHTMDTWCAARRRHFAVPRAPPPRACPPRVRCRAQPVGSRLASRVVQVLQPVP